MNSIEFIGGYHVSKINNWRLFLKNPYAKISLYIEFIDYVKINPSIKKKVFFEVELDGINFITYTFTIGKYELKLDEKRMDNYTYKHLKTFNEMNHNTSIIGRPPRFSVIKWIKKLFNQTFG